MLVCEGQIEVLLLGGSSMKGSQTLSAALRRVDQFDGERVLMRGEDIRDLSGNYSSVLRSETKLPRCYSHMCPLV